MQRHPTLSSETQERPPSRSTPGSRSVIGAVPTEEERIVYIWSELQSVLRSLCRGHPGISSMIEDLRQDIIVKLLEDNRRRLLSFQGRSTIRTWLFSVARHHVANHLRSREETVRLEEVALASLVQIPSEETELLGKERTDVLRKALARLNRRDRELLELCCLHEAGHREIAERLSLKYRSVRQRKYVLIRKLRKCLLVTEAGIAR